MGAEGKGLNKVVAIEGNHTGLDIGLA